MAVKPPFHVVVARLPDDLSAIHHVRREVFVAEQGIPEQLEWDGRDPLCQHVLARDTLRQPIGTGRIDPQGRIGRMAVLAVWRSRGVGAELLAALLALAGTQGFREVVVHAQSRVTAFYRQAGFRDQGPPFSEAGIEHRLMVKALLSGNN